MARVETSGSGVWLKLSPHSTLRIAMKNVGSMVFLPEKKDWVCRFVSVELASRFREALFAEIRNPDTCDVLRDASLSGDLSGWTRQLTTSCVLACRVMGWRASAKGH